MGVRGIMRMLDVRSLHDSSHKDMMKVLKQLHFEFVLGLYWLVLYCLGIGLNHKPSILYPGPGT